MFNVEDVRTTNTRNDNVEQWSNKNDRFLKDEKNNCLNWTSENNSPKVNSKNLTTDLQL